MFYHANNNDNRRIVSICKLNLCMLAYNEHHAQMSLIAPSERSKPGAYQTFMDSKCGRGEVVPSHGAGQVPSPEARNSLLWRLGPLKLRSLCARFNHFLGVYRKNGDYHLLCFFRALRHGVLCFFC